MEKMELYLKIILALITLIGIINTGIIVPYYHSKTTKEEREKHIAIVKSAVYAAEQLQTAGLLKIPKKEYVLSYLQEKGWEMTPQDLDILIEAAVKALNIDQDKKKVAA